MLRQRVGQILVQAENFRKSFTSMSVPHLRVPLKHAGRRVSRFKWADERKRGKNQRGTGGAEHGAGRSMDGLEQDAPAT
jgi:hypothetical protein